MQSQPAILQPSDLQLTPTINLEDFVVLFEFSLQIW